MVQAARIVYRPAASNLAERSASNVPNSPRMQNGTSAPQSADEAVAGPLLAKQSMAVEMLAAGQPSGQVAFDLAIDRRTLYRWRQDPAFRDALDRAVDALNADVRHQSALLLKQALRIAREKLNDDPAPARLATRLLTSKQLWKLIG
ncbi:MAG: phBC6A51 family helix-turn-helix protein [Tepidisphaeraceae bacterium]